MMFYALLAYTSALLSSGLVIFVLCARRQTVVHWSFAVGMSTIAQVQGVTLNHTIFAREECQLV